MGLETGTYVADLVTTNPTSGDLRSAGDDHLRLIKSVLKATFPGADGVMMTKTAGEISINDAGADLNFRVETSLSIYGIYLDGGNGRFGVGTGSPEVPFHVARESQEMAVFEDTTDDAGLGPNLQLRRSRSVGGVGDVNGSLSFVGPDDGGADTTYARLYQYIGDPTGGAEDGGLIFQISVGASLRNFMQFNGAQSEIVLNESGVDQDFRVESANNIRMLFVDGGGDLVGIGGIPVNFFDLRYTDVGALGPVMGLYHDSGSPAVSDVLGRIRIEGNNSSAARYAYWDIQSEVLSKTAGSESATLTFLANPSVGGTQALQLNSTGQCEIGLNAVSSGATAGFPQMSVMSSGTPSGAAPNGSFCLVNSSNSLYVRVSGSWLSVALT